MSKKCCVILSGCGFLDGAEIHEAVLTLLAIERQGGTWQACAPNVDFNVVDHMTHEETGQTRNVLTESARIARGNIVDIDKVKAEDFDALLMPGGFGAAKNLSDFAIKGTNATVHPAVERVIREFLEAGKPCGVICIAPATFARVVANAGRQATLTVGNANDHGDAINGMTEMPGISHKDTAVDDACIDEEHKIASTPAYMIGPGISNVAPGIEKVVEHVMKWA